MPCLRYDSVGIFFFSLSCLIKPKNFSRSVRDLLFFFSRNHNMCVYVLYVMCQHKILPSISFFFLLLFKACHMNSDIFMLIALFRAVARHIWPELFTVRSLPKYFNYDLIRRWRRRRTITVITISGISTSTNFSVCNNKAIAMHKILFADWTVLSTLFDSTAIKSYGYILNNSNSNCTNNNSSRQHQVSGRDGCFVRENFMPSKNVFLIYFGKFYGHKVCMA